MRYILVLQWPGSSESDFETLISIEDRLKGAVGECATVDGHDFGSGEMNIFLETDQPSEAFAVARTALQSCRRWADVRAAYREASGQSYTVLWPPGHSGFAVS